MSPPTKVDLEPIETPPYLKFTTQTAEEKKRPPRSCSAQPFLHTCGLSNAVAVTLQTSFVRLLDIEDPPSIYSTRPFLTIEPPTHTSRNPYQQPRNQWHLNRIGKQLKEGYAKSTNETTIPTRL